MNLHPDDPQFTAWLLGELPADEADAIARHVATDPALQHAAADATAFHGSLTTLLSGTSSQLTPQQRHSIIHMAKSNATVVTMPRRSNARWWISSAAAAALVCGLWVHNNRSTQPNEKNLTNTSEATPKEIIVSSDTVKIHPPTNNTRLTNNHQKYVAKQLITTPPPRFAEIPELRSQAFLNSALRPQLDLPLQIGQSSWEWIARSVIEENQLPPPRMVRIEEVVNAFPHALPDAAPAGQSLTVTAAPSPLHVGRQWVFATIKNNANTKQNARLTYQAAPNSSYRLAGFESPQASDVSANDTIPAQTATTLMLEVASTDVQALGSMRIEMNGKSDTYNITAIETPDLRHRHLSCVASFAMWLNDKNVPLLPILKEVDAIQVETSSPEIRSSLDIIRKAAAMPR